MATEQGWFARAREAMYRKLKGKGAQSRNADELLAEIKGGEKKEEPKKTTRPADPNMPAEQYSSLAEQLLAMKKKKK
jgi:hypothetical protein